MTRSRKKNLQPPPPNAPPWATEAYRLIKLEGYSWARAAEAVEKSVSSVRYWLEAGQADYQTAKATRWREENPERVRELGRIQSRRFAERHPERKRQLTRESYHRLSGPTCPGCGYVYSYGHKVSYRACPGCRELRREWIVVAWDRGLSLREIAEAFGWSVNRLGGEMIRMRDQGYDLPFRLSYPRRARA